MAERLIDYRTFGYLRVAVAAPQVLVGDVAANLAAIRKVCEEALEQGCRFLLLPELAVTGYTCGDLFFEQTLLRRAEEGLVELARLSGALRMTIVVGAPVASGGRLFNTAAVLNGGAVVGVVPKSFLPNTAEFYEERWFSAAADAVETTVRICGSTIPFGADLIFADREHPSLTFGIEICEDLWSVIPPSCGLALAGASLILNPSASPESLAKESYRRDLVVGQSARTLGAYLYASAGPGESSTDLVYSGHCLIAENGILLAESERFSFAGEMIITDIDLDRLQSERRLNNSFGSGQGSPVRIIPCDIATEPLPDLRRAVQQRPFVPSDSQARDRRCQDIFRMQVTALAKRLRHAGSPKAVIGISGGLDSTLALLVTAKAFGALGRDLQEIVAITMPGPGTTDRTRGNAERFAEHLGVTLKIIPIGEAVEQHFRDIGHDPADHSIVFENVQARERTQILMDVANQVGGIVIGTGDLSELALGWCTYNADHMSMYGVNCGVPKTLVRYLVEWCADAEFSGEAAALLHDIGATPVSPELLPPDDDGTIRQKTEDTLGPYLVHDFFLYQMVRCHFPPAKIHALACIAFADQFNPLQLKKWLELFYRRFFSQQFKRSCLPDGPKIGSVALSPRGDWRMPSDASAALWLAEVAAIACHDRQGAV